MYDSAPGGDPRAGPVCPKCGLPIAPDEPKTLMRIREDPEGTLGLSGAWHATCARPDWDTLTRALNVLRNARSKF